MDSAPSTASAESPVRIDAGAGTLEGSLTLPHGAAGVVIFAHGSGSSRHSPRNRYVAEILGEARLGTLLIDLLTPEEEKVDARTAHLRFDIDHLAARLALATRWFMQQPLAAQLPLAYFGASTGAAAALVAAASEPGRIAAVVSRGGRPDLAGPHLGRVTAPTLLIVGGRDHPVIGMNEEALEHLVCPKEMVIVPGATHLFEEPGALEEVARLASDWFSRFLVPAQAGGT